MRRALSGMLLTVSLPLAALAGVEPYPATFRTMDIPTEGAVIHVRVAGRGPAILMLHGFGDTGDMWQPLAIAMMHEHTVVVPDLRGMGLSSHPDIGYDKKTQARDLAQVLDSLNVGRVDLLGKLCEEARGGLGVCKRIREMRRASAAPDRLR